MGAEKCLREGKKNTVNELKQYYYLHQGGYDFDHVCLSNIRITERNHKWITMEFSRMMGASPRMPLQTC